MERIARVCARRRITVVMLWLLLVVWLSFFSGAFGGATSDDYELPGSESQAAVALMHDAGFDARAGNQSQVVVQSERPLDDPQVARSLDGLGDRLEEELPEAEIVSPLAPEGSSQTAPGARVAYFAVSLPELDADRLEDVGERLAEVRETYTADGLTVEVGGVPTAQESEGPPSEVIGIVAAVVILLLAFGSVLSMTLPILVGIVGAGSGVALVGLGANVVDVPAFASPVAAMIAIGVGIDYALLVVTRYRESLRAGASVDEAIVIAHGTAGRSVVFAGTIVVIASLGLVLMGLKLITGVALGIAAAVLMTMLAAVTLLPALLAIVRGRIDRLRVGRGPTTPATATLSARWSRIVQRRPLRWAIASAAVLVVLAIPALDMRLGFSDAGTKPSSDTGRRAYDLIADGFGPGANGPLVLAADLDELNGRGDLDDVASAVAADPGVAFVSEPVVSSDARVALLTVIPTTGPRSAATTELVHRLRDSVVPGAAPRTDAVAVGGTTAAAVDFADYTASRLPIFLGVVLGLALLLLLIVFRGVVVAVKAVLVNLLSIGAAFGAVVALFQWGWGVDLLGLEGSGPVEAWVPMMLIAIVFGLSMDYEVFLLSRIKEEYESGLSNADAVAAGLAKSARVITAAAAIMVCVFGSFVLGSSRELQLFGFGLAFAVIIDATLVRMVLVPATMELLGDRNWWLPRWADRIIPHLSVEGGRPAHRTRSPQPADR